MHACDKKERADGNTVWAKSSQSTICADTDHGTLTAGIVRRSEEMKNGVDDAEIQKANDEMGAVGGQGLAGYDDVGVAGVTGSGR